jgi:hypothetical protein
MKAILTALAILLSCSPASAQWNGSWNTGWSAGWSGGDAGYVNPRYVLLNASLDSSTVTLGPELITNGNFSAWSGAADPDNTPTGWNKYTSAAGYYMQNASGAARLVTDGTVMGIWQTLTLLPVGRTAKIELDIDANTGNGILFSGLVTAAIYTTTTGHKTHISRVSNVNIGPVRASGSPSDVTFDDVSVKEYYLSDASTSARHLSPANQMTWNTLTSGIKVLNFDGTTDLIDTGADYYGTGAITLVRWIRPETAGEGSAGRIVSNGKLIVALDNTGGRISVTSDGGTITVYSATGAWDANTWSHLVVSIDAAGKATVCINGALSGTAQQASGTRAAGTGNVFFGNAADASKTFDGDIYGAIDIKGTPNDIIGFSSARYMATKDLYQ